MDNGRAIRWGICGTGRVANEFAEGLTLVDDAELIAVASHGRDRAEEFGARWNVANRYVGYESLAKDEDIDVVYVATTQNRHATDTLLFLEAGLAVLCEKPFALSLADARRMIEAAREAGSFLMEALWTRFLPSYVKLGQLLAEGAIGDPQLLEANFSSRVPDEKIEGHRLFDPARGGGAALDLGVYPVQLAHLVFGPPNEIYATARLTGEGLDEQTSMLLGYEGGCAALLHASIRTQGTNGARIAGTEGVIEIAPFMHAAKQITVTRGDRSEIIDFPTASLHFQVPEVHRCLRGGRIESTVMPHSETLAIMATLDEVVSQIGVRYPA